MKPAEPRRVDLRRRAGAAPALLLAAVVTAAGCSGDAVRLPLQPSQPGALVVLSGDARGTFARGRLDVRSRGRSLQLTVRDRTFDLRRTPVLHLRLSHGDDAAAPLSGSIAARRLLRGPRGETPEDGTPEAASRFPATVSHSFDLGPWSRGIVRDVWLDLGWLPGREVPDVLRGEVKDLTLTLSPCPRSLFVAEASLHPRGAALPALVADLLRDGERWPRNLLWLLVLPPIALASALVAVGRAVAKLPRPIGPVVYRNAAARLLRLAPAHLLVLLLAAWGIDAASRLPELTATARAAARSIGRLSRQDLETARDSRLQPGLPALLDRIARSTPETSTIRIPPPVTEAAARLAQYELFPRRVTRRAAGTFTAHLNLSSLPRLRQEARGAFMTLTPDHTVGQVYSAPPCCRRVIALRIGVQPGTLQADEVLTARFYPRGLPRQFRASSTVRGGTLFKLAEPFPTTEIAYFDIVHGGGGDGAVQLAVSRGDADPSGAIVTPAGAQASDLVYELAFEPDGLDLVAWSHLEGSVHRAIEGVEP